MNGAQALIRTLASCGIEVCFTNPGTSEMHFVAALDTVPEMRGILGLFEGVVTGAADGYGRMAGKPAATLLHLGSGLGNGVANLHNARRAFTPIVNIVGDHATYHNQYDPPLASDINSIAKGVSSWIRSSASPALIAEDAADAVRAATGPPGQVATLILPADVSWSEGAEPAKPRSGGSATILNTDVIEEVAKVLATSRSAALLLGGAALRKVPLAAAELISKATGAKVLCETFPTRLERGAGIASVERLGYLAEFMALQLDGVEDLVLIGAKAPVSFFAYPGKESYLVPEGCTVHTLATCADDVAAAVSGLADCVGSSISGSGLESSEANSASGTAITDLGSPQGELSAELFAHAVAAVLPEGAIISDESNTSGLFLAGATANCPAHDILTLTGGAIGQGMPVATGAAVACPDRPVLSLESDGSAMYTAQSLWTQSRENLNVTTVILNNGSYAVLNMELNRVGAEPPGPKAKKMLDITGPSIDFVALGQSMGVPGIRVDRAEDLVKALNRAIEEPGPHLIEAMVPSII
ncbi:MAG TPA: acetolactate synthase large subunit [Acidimicrobiales bacterium]|nr:acetolactate synthase large subunit [Acidimicrobiales bacterium]